MSEKNRGLVYGATAFIIWGLVPIGWKFFTHIQADEIMVFRVVSALVIYLAILLSQKKYRQLKQVLFSRQSGVVFICSLLLASNWLVFVYAVLTDRILETSFGYFISPLFSIGLGYLVLKEELAGLRRLAVLLAIIAVTYRFSFSPELPFISAFLASTFGVYGLLKKRIALPPSVSMTLEVLFMLPLAIAYYVYLWHTGQARTNSSLVEPLGIFFVGMVTAAPLVFFTAAVNRINLSAVGFLQFIAPSMTFLLGLLVYHEPFHLHSFISFVIIWAALVIFLIDLKKRGMKKRYSSASKN